MPVTERSTPVGTLRRGPQAAGPLLSCYYPLGDPMVPVERLDLYAEQGVDVVEIGMSSTHPFLDGPDVAQSMARTDRSAVRADLDAVLNRLAGLPNAPSPLLMCYADTDHPGRSDPSFWAGLDSVLVVARPHDPVADEVQATARAAGVATSAFVTVPLEAEGIAAAQAAEYYVMLQAGAGKTGPRTSVDQGSRARIAQLREAGVQAPILLGFGISNGAQAREARALGADGVVVGSQVLRAALAGPDQLAQTLADLRGGLDA